MLRCLHNELVPFSIKLKSTLKLERAKKILRLAEKQLLQTRLKSINSLLDNNAKQLELTRAKIASILPAPSYQQCQEFIEKIKETRFTKVREKQVGKFNNLLSKKEGSITWQSSQVFPATRAFLQANNRQVMPATRASQAASSSQAGRSITPRASPQTFHAGNFQASLADSTLSQAESAVSQTGNSQAGNSQASLVGNTLSQVESVISQAGNTQSSQADIALHLAESAVSQAGNSQASLAVNPPNNSSRQAGNTPRVDSTISQPDSEVFSGVIFPGQCFPGSKIFPLPNRQNSPQGSSSLEDPNPKWVINLSSKPLPKAQRSVLAKGPKFAVSSKHPPDLEYITALKAACTKLSQQDAEELRADINQVLRASCPQT